MSILSIKAVCTNVFSDAFFKVKCFALWEAHLRWLFDLGFERAFEQWQVTPEAPALSGHEVVDLLNEFVMTRGYVNAHLGLTSSDIVDNVRLIQIHECLEATGTGVQEVINYLRARFNFDMIETVGFTHWQPAAPLKWSHRAGAWTSPLTWMLATRPAITAKLFGGPVGDMASLKLVVPESKLNDNPFPWEIFDLDHPKNYYPLQSSDHQCEMSAVNWAVMVAAQLHKIALDLRFLASRGTLHIRRAENHAGSSSMPHKTNPYKWEKVCSICRSISTTQQEMWAVMANNSMERTLDTSWQIKQLIARCFLNLGYAIDEMLSVDVVINVDKTYAELSTLRSLISSDRDLTRQVVQGGKTRWSAYNEAIQQKNKSS